MKCNQVKISIGWIQIYGQKKINNDNIFFYKTSL